MTDKSIVTDEMKNRHDEAVPTPALAASGFELAMNAVQARASISHLREYYAFDPQDEAAFDRVMALLGGVIDDHMSQHGR